MRCCVKTHARRRARSERPLKRPQARSSPLPFRECSSDNRISISPKDLQPIFRYIRKRLTPYFAQTPVSFYQHSAPSIDLYFNPITVSDQHRMTFGHRIPFFIERRPVDAPFRLHSYYIRYIKNNSLFFNEYFSKFSWEAFALSSFFVLQTSHVSR